METDQQYCYTNPAGEDIYLFTLRNDNGGSVSITNFGAIIISYKIRMPDGMINDIVLGFDQIEDYTSPDYLKQYPWFGSAIGRYANRIKNARFELDGKQYQLTKNDKNEQLHGGAGGFDRRVWSLAAKGNSPFAWLELKYLSPDGEEGFPGNLEVILRFELNNDNSLSLEYHATCDHPTPCNLTHHSYFNLENGEDTIEKQEVRVYSSTMLEQDENLVATGKILPVSNTAHDLREFRAIGEAQAPIGEFDKSYIVDNKTEELQLMAEARSLKNNLLLQVYSTDPILHFYSGKWTPLVKGKKGQHYGPFSGFCMEAHKHPNAVNIPDFPNTILRPGETYYQKTVYRLFITN